MYSLNKMQGFLRDKTLSAVAKETNISYPTLLAIREGSDRKFELGTLKKLNKYMTQSKRYLVI